MVDAQRLRLLHLVEPNEPHNPAHIDLFGIRAVVAQVELLPHLVEQTGRSSLGGWRSVARWVHGGSGRVWWVDRDRVTLVV